LTERQSGQVDKLVIDSNVIIDWSNGVIDSAGFFTRFGNCRKYISEITEIEVFAKPDLDEHEERRIRAFLKTVTIIPLTRAVKDATIQFRRATHRKLPDSIIAGTALALGARVITSDPHLLGAAYPGFRVEGL